MRKLLILGGTNFIGRHFIESIANRKDIEITLFNRQRTNQHLFPTLNKVKGDRETNEISGILNTNWDIIVDFSSYYPDSLEYLIHQLKGKVKRYIYISTCSVYDFKQESIGLLKENSPLTTCAEDERTDTTNATYGKRKVACEEVLKKAAWLDSIILRPSVIFGQYDFTERYYYWLYRIADKQPFLLPENGQQQMTLTYVEDLTNILIQSLDITNHRKIYNITSHGPETFESLLMHIDENLNTMAISRENINQSEVLRDQIFPICFPIDLAIDNSKLTSDFNIEFVPWKKAIEASIAYHKSQGWNEPIVGMNRQTELDYINRQNR